MHSYHHNIKTFNSATRHLTRVERALYRDLIELYYDTEKPLTGCFDRLARLVIAHSDEDKNALKYVLAEFFELTGGVYTHSFCDDEIEKFQANNSAKAKAGRASAEARKKKAAERKRQREQAKEQDLTPVEHVLNTSQASVHNHKPITNNHKPITTSNNTGQPWATQRKKFKPDISLCPTWGWPNQPSNAVFDGWLAMRRKNKFTISENSMKRIGAGLRTAVEQGFTVDDCLSKAELQGWKGMDAQWMVNTQPRAGPVLQHDQHMSDFLEGGCSHTLGTGRVIQGEVIL